MRQFTEDEIRMCPHLQKQQPVKTKAERTAVPDSPFKEKITMNSESEATPVKQMPFKEDLPAECPFSKQGASNNKTKAEESEEEEEEEPTGGCPVMNQNPKKRNPGYFVPEVTDSEVYVSPFAQVIESHNIFTRKRKDKDPKWNSYPIFLKHSLLYMGPLYDKYRKLEVGYKFFVTDELREKGNACFQKGKFADALSHYEKAVSIMTWLEFTPDEFVQHMKKMPKFPSQMPSFKEDMTVEDIQRFKQESAEAAKAKAQEDKEAEGKPVEKDQKYYDERLNDLLLTSLGDANVELVEGHDLKEKADRDIHENILFQLYGNMAVCYLKMKNLNEAKLAIREMGKIKSDSSLFLFRQAQIITADRSSTLEELKVAQKGIRKALELKKTEKIFEHNPTFLKIFSLENHETVFGELLTFANRRVTEKKEELTGLVRNVLKRAKEIEQAELNIIARGLVPEEGRERTLLLFSADDSFEKRLLDGMTEKYHQAIQFFSASEKSEDAEQVGIAQRALAKLNALQQQTMWLWNFDFSTPDRAHQAMIEEANAEFQIKFDSEKVQKRLKRIQREQARDAIEKYQFDLQLFEHVVGEIFKEDKKKEDAKKSEAALEESGNLENEQTETVKKGPSFGAQLIGVALFLLILAYFGRSILFKKAF